jgi:DnaJ-class molecular chaperone
MSDDVKCPWCHGTGKLTTADMPDDSDVECPECHGSGVQIVTGDRPMNGNDGAPETPN